MRRRSGLRAALAALWIVSVPIRSAGEGEDAGFSFHPSLEVTNVVDDEPGLGLPGRSNEIDVGFWLAPGVEVGYRTHDFQVGADLGMQLRRYIEQDRLADELIDVSGFVEAGLLPGLSVRISDAYAPQYRALGLPEDHGANLAQANRVDGELRYWHDLGGATELEVAGGLSHFLTERFMAGFPAAAGPGFDPKYRADFWQAAGLGQLSRPLGSHWATYVTGQLGFRDYSDGKRSDHWNGALLVGVRSERFDNLELEIEAGYGLISFNTLGDVHQPVGRARLRQRLPLGFAWTALVANRFRSNLVGNEVFEATAELGLEKQLGEAMDASLQVFAAHFDDRGAQANAYGGLEAELGYDMTSQSRLSLSYRHWRNRGDASFDDMTQNSVFLRLSLRR